jgi:hypothetical protein
MATTSSLLLAFATILTIRNNVSFGQEWFRTDGSAHLLAKQQKSLYANCYLWPCDAFGIEDQQNGFVLASPCSPPHQATAATDQLVPPLLAHPCASSVRNLLGIPTNQLLGYFTDSHRIFCTSLAARSYASMVIFAAFSHVNFCARTSPAARIVGRSAGCVAAIANAVLHASTSPAGN